MTSLDGNGGGKDEKMIARTSTFSCVLLCLMMIINGLPHRDSQHDRKNSLSPIKLLSTSFEQTYTQLNNTFHKFTSNITMAMNHQSILINNKLEELKNDLLNLADNLEKVKVEFVEHFPHLPPISEWIDQINNTVSTMASTIVTNENMLGNWTKMKGDLDDFTKTILQPFQAFTENTHSFSLLPLEDKTTLSHIRNIYLQILKHLLELIFEVNYQIKRMTIIHYLIVENDDVNDSDDADNHKNDKHKHGKSMTLEEWHHILDVQANVQKAGYDYHLVYFVQHKTPSNNQDKPYSKAIVEDINMLQNIFSSSHVTILRGRCVYEEEESCSS